eukprot:3346806-Amphidinium_carterae.1
MTTTLQTEVGGESWGNCPVFAASGVSMGGFKVAANWLHADTSKRYQGRVHKPPSPPYYAPQSLMQGSPQADWMCGPHMMPHGTERAWGSSLSKVSKPS